MSRCSFALMIAATSLSLALLASLQTALLFTSAHAQAQDIQSMQPYHTVNPANRVTLDRYWTVPDDIPLPTVVNHTTSFTGSASLAEGYLFISPHERRVGSSVYEPYLLIVDNDGELVYHYKVPPDQYADHSRLDDFKVLDNGLLSYWVGGLHRHLFRDSTYEVVGTVLPVGNVSDLHDIQVMPNGNYLLIVYSLRYIDVSEVVDGGSTNMAYINCHIQEIDPQGELVFEWRSEDHYAITDTYHSLVTTYLDAVHCNSVEQDTDGNLLISSRDLYEVTKINRATGEIMWRFGGKNNQFEMINAIDAEHVLFEKQHDARRVANGNLTVFDNRLNTYSRVVEYELDEDNLTATLVWEHRHTPDLFGKFLGNAQRLPNGNTLISWGDAATTVTEVTRDGQTLLELSLPPEMVTYRAYRFPWTGHPSTPPDLAVIREIEQASITNTGPLSQTTSIQLAYSWNGATEVAAYNVYGDASAFPQTLIATQPKTGFETTTIITDSTVISAMVQENYHVRVVPLNANGIPFTNTSDMTNTISSATHRVADAIIVPAAQTQTQTQTTTHRLFLPWVLQGP
ncbi:MAG: aryl-sulfate sulfotransferase [Chloroflexota bacterium]